MGEGRTSSVDIGARMMIVLVLRHMDGKETLCADNRNLPIYILYEDEFGNAYTPMKQFRFARVMEDGRVLYEEFLPSGEPIPAPGETLSDMGHKRKR